MLAALAQRKRPGHGPVRRAHAEDGDAQVARDRGLGRTSSSRSTTDDDHVDALLAVRIDWTLLLRDRCAIGC